MGLAKNEKCESTNCTKNQSIKKHQAQLKVVNRQKIQLLKKELEVINNNRSKTREVLQRYYSLNVIYPKYRNFVAISSFYEYLVSGRCDGLEGHEGAYNIYETEMRLDKIIVQLDEVIERLNEIKQNQHMLYWAINENKKQTEYLIREVHRSVDALHRIEENTAVSAYNTHILAQNTEFLRWVTALRNGKLAFD